MPTISPASALLPCPTGLKMPYLWENSCCAFIRGGRLQAKTPPEKQPAPFLPSLPSLNYRQKSRPLSLFFFLSLPCCPYFSESCNQKDETKTTLPPPSPLFSANGNEATIPTVYHRLLPLPRRQAKKKRGGGLATGRAAAHMQQEKEEEGSKKQPLLHTP